VLELLPEAKRARKLAEKRAETKDKLSLFIIGASLLARLQNSI
jgi:hypothetical protein